MARRLRIYYLLGDDDVFFFFYMGCKHLFSLLHDSFIGGVVIKAQKRNLLSADPPFWSRKRLSQMNDFPKSARVNCEGLKEEQMYPQGLSDMLDALGEIGDIFSS